MKQKLALWLINAAARLLWAEHAEIDRHYHNMLVRIVIHNQSPAARKAARGCPICFAQIKAALENSLQGGAP